MRALYPEGRRAVRIVRSSFHSLGSAGQPERDGHPFRLSAQEDDGYPEEESSASQRGMSAQRFTSRVLIVEDDADLRETLADILQYEGFRVDTAGNGQEAWARLETEPVPALILLDLMMPMMNGWEFRVRQLREPQYAGIPVVIISAADSVQHQSAMLSANGFLLKPIDVSILLDIVSRFVG